MNRHFTKEYVWMTNKPMKRYSTSLAIRKMQMKFVMSFHYISPKRAEIKKKNSQYQVPMMLRRNRVSHALQLGM